MKKELKIFNLLYLYYCHIFNNCTETPILLITFSDIQNTGFTCLIFWSPSNDSPAKPNTVWNGSTYKKLITDL